MMKQVSALGVPMCQPIEFGTCEGGVPNDSNRFAKLYKKSM